MQIVKDGKKLMAHLCTNILRLTGLVKRKKQGLSFQIINSLKKKAALSFSVLLYKITW